MRRRTRRRRALARRRLTAVGWIAALAALAIAGLALGAVLAALG